MKDSIIVFPLSAKISSEMFSLYGGSSKVLRDFPPCLRGTQEDLTDRPLCSGFLSSADEAMWHSPVCWQTTKDGRRYRLSEILVG